MKLRFDELSARIVKVTKLEKWLLGLKLLTISLSNYFLPVIKSSFMNGVPWPIYSKTVHIKALATVLEVFREIEQTVGVVYFSETLSKL